MNTAPEEVSVLEKSRALLRDIVERESLLDARVSVLAKPLTPEEAIGNPGRREFPIITGKERVIEATVLEAKGHAFTDSPREFDGTIGEVLELDLDTNQSRAVFVATLNAVFRHLGRATATVHCRDEDPELCAEEIATLLLDRYGRVKVGLIGMNPAIAERLVDTFGEACVHITDLNADNIDRFQFGVEMWDGCKRTQDLIDFSDVLVITGTTLVNGTFDDIYRRTRTAGKPCLVYGVTAAGASELLGVERICPRGR
jgi:uncharacterized protein (DUF4213/DUF364 family)